MRRGGRGRGIIFGLTRLLPMQGFHRTMLMLIPTQFYAMSLNSNFQAAQYLWQTYIDDQLFSQSKQKTRFYL